jgi:hypothetical protein
MEERDDEEREILRERFGRGEKMEHHSQDDPPYIAAAAAI